MLKWWATLNLNKQLQRLAPTETTNFVTTNQKTNLKIFSISNLCIDVTFFWKENIPLILCVYFDVILSIWWIEEFHNIRATKKNMYISSSSVWFFFDEQQLEFFPYILKINKILTERKNSTFKIRVILMNTNRHVLGE